MSIVPVSTPSSYNVFLYFLEEQKYEDSKLGIMINVGKCRLVKVIFSNIHKISDACVNILNRYIVIAQCMRNVFTFLWKNGVSGKIKANLPPASPNITTIVQSLTFLMLFKDVLAPASFKKESRDYALCMTEYKVQTIKLLPFYMTDLLFIEL